MYGLFAVAVSLSLIGISQPLTAQTPPPLGPDNFYTISDTSICVKGAICTEDVFCDVGDVAVGGGMGFGLGNGNAAVKILALDHLGIRLDSMALKIDNGGSPSNIEMTVSGTCLDVSSIGQ